MIIQSISLPTSGIGGPSVILLKLLFHLFIFFCISISTDLNELHGILFIQFGIYLAKSNILWLQINTYRGMCSCTRSKAVDGDHNDHKWLHDQMKMEMSVIRRLSCCSYFPQYYVFPFLCLSFLFYFSRFTHISKNLFKVSSIVIYNCFQVKLFRKLFLLY